VGIAGVLGILLVIGLEKVVIIYTIKKTLLVQEKYLVQSKDFFEKHGGRAIIFARFYQYLEHTYSSRNCYNGKKEVHVL
jgi:membrane-associated protein